VELQLHWKTIFAVPVAQKSNELLNSGGITMVFCGKCGQKVEEGVKFCPACGTPLQANADQSVNDASPQSVAESTAEFEKKDIEQNKVMAILAYFGILVFIPILAARESKFARYHANQGLILFIVLIGWKIIDYILTSLLRALLWRSMGLWEVYSLCGTILNLVYFVFAILAIIGIVNALNGKAKELPVIGKYKILK
jgi:uncharacterized membrane protein